MFRSAVILTGILACEVGLPCLLDNATAGPAARDHPSSKIGARALGPTRLRRTPS
jgi:hypothetical protein